MWQSIYKGVDTISKSMAWIAGGAILLIAIMQVVEIVARNFFAVSLTFVWEYAAYMHIAAIFMALSFTLRSGGHIQVTLLGTVMPRVFDYLSTITGLIISSYLSYAMVRLCLNWGTTGRTSGTVDNLPLVYPMIFVAFGAVMLTVQLLLRVIHLIVGTPSELQWSNSPSAE